MKNQAFQNYFPILQPNQEPQILLHLHKQYHNDDRNNDSTDIFQNDLFLATRLNFNDTDGTEFLTSITLDTDGGGNTSTLELSSRITDNIRVTGSYNAYWSVNEKDILYSFRRDNYFLINITNYF